MNTCLTGLVGLLGIPWLTAPLWGQAGNRNNTPLPPVVVFRSTDPVVVTPPIDRAVARRGSWFPAADRPCAAGVPGPPGIRCRGLIIDGTILAEPVTVFSPVVAAPPVATPWMPVQSTTVYSPVTDYPPVTGYVPPPTY